MSRTHRAALAVLSALAALVLALSGCSDDGTGVREGDTGSEGSSSESGSSSQ